MKRDPLPALLVGVLVLAVLATATLSFAYVQYMRKLRALQVDVAVANRNWAMFQQLASETVEYSKRNPKIDKILEEVGINKIKPLSDQATAPSGGK